MVFAIALVAGMVYSVMTGVVGYMFLFMYFIFAIFARLVKWCAMKLFSLAKDLVSKFYFEIGSAGGMAKICYDMWEGIGTWYQGLTLAAMMTILYQNQYKKRKMLVVVAGYVVCAELSAVDANGNTILGLCMQILIDHVSEVTKAFDVARTNFIAAYVKLHPHLAGFLVDATKSCLNLQNTLNALWDTSNQNRADKVVTAVCAVMLVWVLSFIFYVLIHLWWKMVKWVLVQVLKMGNYEITKITKKEANVDLPPLEFLRSQALYVTPNVFSLKSPTSSRTGRPE